MTKTTAQKTINLYHRHGTRVVGIGRAGPQTALALPADIAEIYEKRTYWSRKPFPIEADKPVESEK